MRVPAAVYVALGVGLTLGAAIPGSISAQVPRAEPQPRVAVPARAGDTQTAPPAETPVAQPAQPTAAPTAAAPAEPAPVGAAPAPSGVTQLPPAAAPPATASSSQAAMAKHHSYGAGNFALALDGVGAGSVRAVEGGAAVGTVVTQGSKKHVAGVKYEELSLKVGLESKPVVEWIKSTWEGKSATKNLSVSVADQNYKVVARRDYTNALLTGTTIPALDAASKEALSFTLTVAPDQVREMAGDGSSAKGFDPKQKKWLLSNFRFEMGDLPGNRVSRIESFTVGQKVAEDQQVGEFRLAEKQAGPLVFPNLRITLSQADAADWARWHDEFVVKGNNGDEQEKNGAIVFVDPTMKNELGRISLQNCGIFRFGSVTSGAKVDKVAQVSADLYCEGMQLAVKDSW